MSGSKPPWLREKNFEVGQITSSAWGNRERFMPEEEPLPFSGIGKSLRSSLTKSPLSSRNEKGVRLGYIDWDGGREMELPFPSLNW
jgi:hypothetical protein